MTVVLPMTRMKMLREILELRAKKQMEYWLK
jgi:hypothetical protein